MSKGGRASWWVSPACLEEDSLWGPGGGLGAGCGGQQVEEGRGSVNGDENHQPSPDVSVLQRENCVTAQEGKALIAELKEDIFPELQTHSPQRDWCTKLRLPPSCVSLIPASPHVWLKVDARCVNQGRAVSHLLEISDLWARNRNLSQRESSPKSNCAIFFPGFQKSFG